MPFNKPHNKSTEEGTHKGAYDRGYLPHIDQPHLTQFITFRLFDSMPRGLRQRWEEELGHLGEDRRKLEIYRRVEQYIDQGIGSCWMKEPEIGAIVQKHLLHEHGNGVSIKAWVLMPNHVHVVAEFEDKTSLPTFVQAAKKSSARYANEALGRSGTFWFREYHDRWIRNEEHLEKTIAYVEHNPVKAGLCLNSQDFAFSSASYRDAEGSLQVPRA